jgi:hypothetical protein
MAKFGLLRKTEEGYAHWCPGCGESHLIYTEKKRQVNWGFNGDGEKPTFNPSVKISWGKNQTGVERICHYFIRNGEIQFCDDSTHHLRGKTVPLEEMPAEEAEFWDDD